jgi:MFS family permease
LAKLEHIQYFNSLEQVVTSLRKRKRASTYLGSVRIGAGLTPILVIPIQQKYGWQMSFYILGGVGLLWVIFGFSGTEEPSEAKDISKEELNFILENRQLSDHSPKQSVWKILNHPNLWILFLMYYCYAAGAYFSKVGCLNISNKAVESRKKI